jgi:putative membrane protein
MGQHLMLVVVAAPLLVFGLPHATPLWALPGAARRAIGIRLRRSRPIRSGWRILSKPLVVWALHTAALWVWHLPSLYQAALVDGVVHAAEHASFFGTAILFWWTVVVSGARGRLDRGVGVLYVFTMAMQSGLLGALMTFSPVPWYPIYGASVRAWGLTPIEDQQLAGLIMWIPTGLAYTAVALALFAAWLGDAERTVVRRELRPADRCGVPEGETTPGSTDSAVEVIPAGR